MKTNNLLLYGAVAVGAIFLYNRYTKKPQGKDEQGGGGGGGGGFGPVGPLPVIPNVVVVNPATSTQGRSYTKPMTASVSLPTQVSAPTSSTSAGAQSGYGVSNTGGIVPVSQGGSVTPQYSTGSVLQTTSSDISKGISGGVVFKPFDGDNGRLRLENLVRSFNRP